MVSVSLDDGRGLIILRPNRSADWRANRLLWLLVAAHSLLITAGFALAGAWMILPFAGVELLVLGAALWFVNRKCSHQEVITLDGAVLAIEKGVERPQRHWRFTTGETSVSVHDAPYPNDPPRISLCSRGEKVDIGGFLGLEERRELLMRLRDCGLRVRDHGAHGAQRF